MGAQPRRSAEQLRNAFDINTDGTLDVEELTRLLAAYERDPGDSQTILNSIDTSKDGHLSVEELVELHSVLHPVALEDSPPAQLAQAQPTIWDVFGNVTPRGLEPGSTPSPPLIAGPVPHFRRLDLDNDGYISVDDLEALLRPVRLSVRPHTVINTLDLDGDYRLSEEEFRASMSFVQR